MLSQVLKILSRVLKLIKELFGGSSGTTSQATGRVPQSVVQEKRQIPGIDVKAQIDQNWQAAQNTLPSRTVIFQGRITTDDANDLMGHLLLLERLSPEPIMLVIESEGGQAYAGLAIYDLLRHLTVPLITVADTVCAGSALLMLLAGHKRYALVDSVIAYSLLSAPMRGEPGDYVIQSRELQRLQASHNEIFQRHIATLNQSGWDLATEREFSTEEALQYKLIDGVVDKIEQISRV
jgi:ATP-dependent Clp protease, protease subunit